MSQKISIRLDKLELQEIDKTAEGLGVTRTDVIKSAIRAYLENSNQEQLDRVDRELDELRAGLNQLRKKLLVVESGLARILDVFDS